MATKQDVEAAANTGDNRPPVYMEGNLVIFRASALGSVCETALAGVLAGLTPSAPPQMLQEKFAEGHALEDTILAEVERRGWVLRAKQGAGQVPVGATAAIRGSWDALGCLNPDLAPDEAGNVYRDDLPRAFFDAKALGKTMWDAYQRKGIHGLLPGYRVQASVYHAITGLPGKYALGLKHHDEKSGDVDILDVEVVDMDEDYYLPMSSIKVKVMRVQKMAKDGIPDSCATPTWPCPVYYAICGDGESKVKARDRKPRVPLEVVDIEKLEALASEAHGLRAEVNALKPKEERIKEITKEIREILDGLDDLDVSVPATPDMAKGTATGLLVPGERWEIEEVRSWVPESVRRAGETRYYKFHKVEGQTEE